MRSLAFVIAVTTVAGTSVVLGLSAALDMTWTPKAAMLLALAAVWLPQSLIVLSRAIRRTKPTKSAPGGRSSRRREP